MSSASACCCWSSLLAQPQFPWVPNSRKSPLVSRDFSDFSRYALLHM
jgi:hypothetical protein